MHLLNHSSEIVTVAYLVLDQASTETILGQINFGWLEFCFSTTNIIIFLWTWVHFSCSLGFISYEEGIIIWKIKQVL